MLCFERKAGESIKIGPDVEIKVLRQEGKCVMLGVSSPFELTIVSVGETNELAIGPRKTSSKPKS